MRYSLDLPLVHYSFEASRQQRDLVNLNLITLDIVGNQCLKASLLISLIGFILSV